jgi:REP element-mobilizing transposase RayT
LPKRFPGIQLDDFIIMPNHVHFILWLPGHDDVGAGLAPPQGQGTASRAPTLGDVVCAFKSISAIAVNKQFERSGTPVWQRNYFERVVRNDQELNAIRQYVVLNPEMWNEDCENPQRRLAADDLGGIRDEIEAVLERAERDKGGDGVAQEEDAAARARRPSALR